MIEEITAGAQKLARRKIGCLIALEKETQLKTYIKTLFANDDYVSYVVDSWQKEDGKFSVSEMVKYQVKKLELNEKNIMTLEFYLSDQAELQTDGTMEFQCN